jgi:type IV pilus assembly protein PilN
MIRVNLLAVERERAKKKLTFQSAQKITLACIVIFALTVSFVAWRFLALRQRSNSVDAEIVAAQQETTRLHSIIKQVQQFEQRKAQLQQRVVLIEQLRGSQTGPVHILDQVSRSLPPMLWLTELKQTGNEVNIEGRCTTLTGLSDFVANLEGSGYFRRSVEIVSTQTETQTQANQALPETIRFTVKAVFEPPSAPPAVVPAAAPQAGG